jgi:hypothetical protein
MDGELKSCQEKPVPGCLGKRTSSSWSVMIDTSADFCPGTTVTTFKSCAKAPRWTVTAEINTSQASQPWTAVRH